MTCKIHGNTAPAILCCHLADFDLINGKSLGWVQAEYDPENPQPGDLMAWCSACDEIYEADGGWNDENDSNFRVVCEVCFDAVREKQSM